MHYILHIWFDFICLNWFGLHGFCLFSFSFYLWLVFMPLLVQFHSLYTLKIVHFGNSKICVSNILYNIKRIKRKITHVEIYMADYMNQMRFYSTASHWWRQCGDWMNAKYTFVIMKLTKFFEMLQVFIVSCLLSDTILNEINVFNGNQYDVIHIWYSILYLNWLHNSI